MAIEQVQTKRDIEALLAGCGLHPRNRFGQNFLIDGNLMRRLVESAGVGSNDVVIEVGPGTGGLTDLLARRAAGVCCIEIDRDLTAIVIERFASSPHVSIICGDTLRSKHAIHQELAERIQGATPRDDGCVKLVANLPYQIATPLVMNLLVDYPQVRVLCFTVQREVADRIISPPGEKAYGPLSVVTQLLTKVDTIARMPPQAFWPQPAVESTMVRLAVVDPPFESRERIRAFVAFVRAAFQHRRKTMRAALAYTIDKTLIDGIADRIDTRRRPESVSPTEWVEIFEVANAK